MSKATWPYGGPAPGDQVSGNGNRSPEQPWCSVGLSYQDALKSWKDSPWLMFGMSACPDQIYQWSLQEFSAQTF